MSSLLVFVRLDHSLTLRARHDEWYARGLLDGHVGEGEGADGVDGDRIGLLELSHTLTYDVNRLADGGAAAPADLLHFALHGYHRGVPAEGLASEWLCPGLDTHYGWPAVIAAASVERLAVALPDVVASLEAGGRSADQVGLLAGFFGEAANAGQVVIVAHV
jgi:hypothetical protein